MDIKRFRYGGSSEVIDVDLDLVDAELEMEIRAKRGGSLLAAIARYAVHDKPMPSWVAEVVCSEWGRSVIANVLKEAEAAVNLNKRG
jgi:hypothetical protein